MTVSRQRSTSERVEQSSGSAVTRASPSWAGGPISEDHAALEFARRFGGRLLYCHDTGAWFRWDETVWHRDATGLAFHWARELARTFAKGAAPRDQYITGRTTFSAGVERFARSDPIFAVTIDKWDSDPFLLGTPGGTVDLCKGTLRKSNASERITKTTAVAPSTEGVCPRWLRFLQEATAGDEGLIRFLQQWCGYCLTGDTREHALLFVYGPGGNGKSVFMNVLTSILNDYATTASMETFTASKHERHPTDLAMLRGARLVTASETEEGRAWAETRIKTLTGGDPITARFMRQDFFTFRPQFKLTLIGNHKPVLHNVDPAARRRFSIVPFMQRPAHPDPELEAKLRQESSGILRWMIDGALDWQANGLTRPQTVADATEEYFTSQDVFGEWLEECCDVELGNHYKKATNAELFGSWRAFAERAGELPGTQKSFAENMQQRGLARYRNAAGRGFEGVRLKISPRFNGAGGDTS
jgi:putative DNA primase/helicase